MIGVQMVVEHIQSFLVPEGYLVRPAARLPAPAPAARRLPCLLLCPPRLRLLLPLGYRPQAAPCHCWCLPASRHSSPPAQARTPP